MLPCFYLQYGRLLIWELHMYIQYRVRDRRWYIYATAWCPQRITLWLKYFGRLPINHRNQSRYSMRVPALARSHIRKSPQESIQRVWLKQLAKSVSTQRSFERISVQVLEDEEEAWTGHDYPEFYWCCGRSRSWSCKLGNAETSSQHGSEASLNPSHK